MKNHKIMRGLFGITLLGGFVAGGAGCSTNTGTGALVGGAVGAGTGAIIGHNSHGRTAEGALIGGAVGAVAGGLIGNAQDQAQQNRRYSDDHYRYERVETRYVSPPPPPEYYEYRTYHYAPRGSYVEYRRYGY